MANRNWLVTGSSGQVGGALEHLIGSDGGWFPHRHELNLAKLPAFDALADSLRERGITAIINCAAHTAVDKAESEEDFALAINGEAPGTLAHVAAALGVPIIHISTDFVFAGDKDGCWTEDDPVGPLNAYGRTKLAGEQAVQASDARHIILRTAWVVSSTGNNFVKTMLRLGRERDHLNVVSDQHGCPTAAADIAQTVIALADRLTSDVDAPTGIYHFVNAGEASWYDLAAFVFDRAGQYHFTAPKLDSIPTSAYPTPARRPANSRLSTERIARDFGIVPRPWQEAVAEIVDTLLGEQGE